MIALLWVPGWLAPDRALAQAAEPEARRSADPALEEIVVTARKREETLQQVPISVSAFSASDLEARSIDSLQQLDQGIPNFDLKEQGNQRGTAIIGIRGILVRRSDIIVDPRVGTYVDGVYLARLHGGLFDVLDIERVEVLRGPQGTLFGRNTTAGLVNLITAKPGDAFEGRAKVGLGNYGRLTTAGMLNLPLVEDQLMLRLSGATREVEGWVRNQSGGDTDWYNTRHQSARASLRYVPNEDVELIVTADYARLSDRNTLPECEWVGPRAGFFAALAAGCDASFLSSEAKSNEDAPRDAPTWTKGASATLTWDLGWADLTSVSSWRRMDLRAHIVDGNPVPFFINHQSVDHQQWAQELRLNGSSLDSRLDWVAGLYYFGERGDEDGNFELSFFGCPVNGSACRFQVTDISNRSFAAFGELTYALSERLALTAGVRRTLERKEIDVFQTDFGVGLNPAGTGSNDERFDAWTPRVNLTFQLTDDLMLYGGWSRGWTSGGFNRGTLFSVAYEPETASVWEVGVKSSWFDRRLIANLSAYYTTYDDIQTSTTRLVDGVVTTPILNAAEADIRGLELELTAQPIPDLLLSGGVGLTDAGYDELSPDARAAGLTRDDHFQHVPAVQFNASAQYSVAVGALGQLTARADWSHRGKTYFSAVNTDRASQDKVGLLNGRVTLALDDGKTEIALWGTNLLNRRYWDDSLNLSALFFFTHYWARPRQYGIEITRHFGN